MKHALEECKKTGKKGKSWKEQLIATNSLARLWDIIWKRKKGKRKKEIKNKTYKCKYRRIKYIK